MHDEDIGYSFFKPFRLAALIKSCYFQLFG